MIGATHAAIAVSCGMLAGCPNLGLALIAGGALLPDLDSPQSTIGRIFMFLSIPLNKCFGHRGVVHSFWIWGLLALSGLIWRPLTYIGAGALLHVIADCATVSGVRAMAPWSDKLFVIFRRSWRIKCGGRAEFTILVIVGTIAWSGHRISQTGGISAALGYITGAPKIAFEEYRLQGLKKCYIDGKLRWHSGEIEDGNWLIIGSKGSNGIFFEHKGKIYSVPEDGKFITARLRHTDERWKTVRLKGFGQTDSMVYFLSAGRWHKADPGDVVFGYLIGDDIVLSDFEENLDFMVD